MTSSPAGLRVLLSAFSCRPGWGSEPEVGFRALTAAASRHQVWVLTPESDADALLTFLDGHPLSSAIHVEAVALGTSKERLGRLGLPAFHYFYDRWQRRVGRRALELEREIDFHVAHHVTLAAYWTRAGVASVDKPFIWGPVGGGVEPPLLLLAELGAWGNLEAAIRVSARRLLSRMPPSREAQRKAEVVFAQNADTAASLRSRVGPTLLPNASAVEVSDVARAGRRNRQILFAARLLPWKGPSLAIRSLRHVASPEVRLRIIGEGPDRPRLERLVDRWGLRGKVTFEGWRARELVLEEVAVAGALVHPALHDEGGLSVAEALSLGTPVVCLDRGGPAELIRLWADSPSVAVPVGRSEVTARRIAAAIDGFLAHPPPVDGMVRKPNVSFSERVLQAYETAAGRPALSA